MGPGSGQEEATAKGLRPVDVAELEDQEGSHAEVIHALSTPPACTCRGPRRCHAALRAPVNLRTALSLMRDDLEMVCISL